MAQIKCICNFRISTVEIPNQIEYWVFSDEEWQENELRNEEHKELLSPSIDVYVCPNCKRIHIYKKGESKPKKIYRLEDE